SADARPTVQERRQRAHRAEELDARAQAAGLGALRLPRGGRGHQRGLPPATAMVDESIPALGQAGEESTCGLEAEAGVWARGEAPGGGGGRGARRQAAR